MNWINVTHRKIVKRCFRANAKKAKIKKQNSEWELKE